MGAGEARRKASQSGDFDMSVQQNDNGSRVKLRTTTITRKGFQWVSGMSTKQECPRCDSPDSLYPEPRICHGGYDETTAGVACMNCGFSFLNY